MIHEAMYMLSKQYIKVFYSTCREFYQPVQLELQTPILCGTKLNLCKFVRLLIVVGVVHSLLISWSRLLFY